MVLEENWAVDPDRVRDFFASLDGCVPTAEGFSLDGCTVALTEASGSLLGRWPMRRTILRLEGEESAVKAVYHLFFLAFLSAGG